MIVKQKNIIIIECTKWLHRTGTWFAASQADLSKIGDARFDSAKEHAAIQLPGLCGMANFCAT
jgi:hypothetical protein